MSKVALSGVPETMLWTLYNRASEAKRPDSILDDEECVRIFDAIDYDYARSFGNPDPTHAVRAATSDRLLRVWMTKHPGGTVVSLGEGLETQALRVDDGRVKWISVDVPEAIAVRERFLPEADRRKHVAKSALDRAWLDEIDPKEPLFVVAQGLFMYFDEADVRGLVAAIAARFSGAELFFDTIPRWFSSMTMKGAKRTPHYELPKMPWGIDSGEIPSFLRSCAPSVTTEVIPYRLPRGWTRALTSVARAIGLGSKLPAMVHARL
jgi:O-methyltransferase involved in polyketide biosynthesis